MEKKQCWMCGSPLIWKGDTDTKDTIYSDWLCPNCYAFYTVEISTDENTKSV